MDGIDRHSEAKNQVVQQLGKWNEGYQGRLRKANTLVNMDGIPKAPAQLLELAKTKPSAF